MLDPDYIDLLSDPLVDLFEEFTQTIINDIARRLAKMPEVSATAAWQMQRLVESGAVYNNVLRELSRLTGRKETELAKAFRDAGVKTMKFDNRIYKEAGFDVDLNGLNLSPAMRQALIAGMQKTRGIIDNFVRTTALTAQRAFIHATDIAYLQVSTGSMSYDEAIRDAIKKVASDGLDVIEYSTGHRDKLDVAIRRAVLTGVSQTASKIQDARMDELGVNLVGVSAHVGARNTGVGPMNHESWQGRVYSRVGSTSKYPNFVETTGYGTGEGLSGWNCRHSYYPFFEGLSEEVYSKSDLREIASKKVRVNGKEISVYEASQMQRAIERNIRNWKRQKRALEAAGKTSVKETAKVREWQGKMRDLLRQSNLDRQYQREQVYA